MSEHDPRHDVRDDATASDPLDRVAALWFEAEAAIGSASGSAELEQLRVRFLGRKAELPQLLRGVRDLPAQERGAVGKAANQAPRRSRPSSRPAPPICG